MKCESKYNSRYVKDGCFNSIGDIPKFTDITPQDREASIDVIDRVILHTREQLGESYATKLYQRDSEKRGEA